METKLPMEGAGSKFEARNPNFETNPNVPNSKVVSLFGFFNFWISHLFRISIFGFRIFQSVKPVKLQGGWADFLF